MERKIKAIQIGLGATGRNAIVNYINRGVELVGAIDVYDAIQGKDVGEICGIENMGVYVENDLEACVKRTQPDIALLMTTTTIDSIYDYVKICLENKVNVVTSSEESFHYMRTNPEKGAELDAIAKDYGVTLVGTGIQDVFYTGLASTLAASAHKVTKIKGTNYAILDFFGVVSNSKNNVGSTMAEFEEKCKNEDPTPNALTIGLYDVAERLGLTVISETLKKTPLVSKTNEDMYCRAFDKTVPAGDLIGTSYNTVLETAEGIILEGDLVEKLAEVGESGICKWEVYGTPDLEVAMPDMHGEHTTASALISRIPDAINARPGFVTVAELGNPKFYAKPLNCYVE